MFCQGSCWAEDIRQTKMYEDAVWHGRYRLVLGLLSSTPFVLLTYFVKSHFFFNLPSLAPFAFSFSFLTFLLEYNCFTMVC